MTETADPLGSFRGHFPRQLLNARRVAGALDAPGCQRRTVLDAAAVNLDKLGSLITHTPRDRQSPFAITRGNQFESQITDNGMAELLVLARRHLGLKIPEARECNLSASQVKEAYPGLSGTKMNDLRATLTRRRVEDMLTKPEQAYNLISHAMTRIEFGGEMAYLEQDALAFAVDGRIHVVEVKSYPRIDGRADPTKASATIRQIAVYVLSLQRLMAEISAPTDIVDTTAMIVLPENLSLRPTAVTIDVDMYVRRLSRQLASVPRAAEILSVVPAGTCLPALPSNPDEQATAAEAARAALAPLPARFSEACVSCPLFEHCRNEAELHRSTARLGSAVAGACGNVTDITAALDLAESRRVPGDAAEAAIAVSLARGAAAARFAMGGNS